METFLFLLLFSVLGKGLCQLLMGIKVVGNTVYRTDDIFTVYTNDLVTITLFGTDIAAKCDNVSLTSRVRNEGEQCFPNETFPIAIQRLSGENNSLKAEATIQGIDGEMYFCLHIQGFWTHQGTEKLRTLLILERWFFLRSWVSYLILVVLFILSALCSALNISLMILQPSTLKLIQMSGEKRERRFARSILPVRNMGNILLCSILLSNVIVNSTITIIIDKITGNNVLITLAVTTFGIVLFGEILPQAVGARYALPLGAYTIWMTAALVTITFVLAYPIGKLLNLILGKEIQQYYSKDKLRILIKEQEKLGCVLKDEMEIISGALALTEKTVLDVMTPISNAYMINYNSNLDYNTMKEIVQNGYTRIPVYSNDKNNIKGILNIKDLTFIDPQDNIPVSTVCTFYNRQILIVSSTTKLPELLDEFKKGKAHLAFVEKLIIQDKSDPYQRLVGLITLEDVIEEIIQDEIVDETDAFTDNTWKRKLLDHNIRSGNFTSQNQFRLSPQLFDAVFCYMITNIPSFNENFVSKEVLKSLLSSKVLVNHSFKVDKPDTNELIRTGTPTRSAILIIQGKVSVKTSSENLFFEGGPFMMFGESVFEDINEYIKKTKFFGKTKFKGSKNVSDYKTILDYSVTSMTDLQYVAISAAQYFHARQVSDNIAKTDFMNLQSEKYHNEWNDLGKVQKDLG